MGKPVCAAEWLLAQTLEPEYLGLNSDSNIMNCVTLGKILAFPGSQFPHLQNEEILSCYEQ